MKKLVALLALLLAVQSYGVYGATQAERIMFSCTLEVGPLCYTWEQNALGKLIGADGAGEVEKKLEEAREKLDEDFIDSIVKKKKSGGGLDRLLKAAGEGLDKAVDAAADALEDVQND